MTRETGFNDVFDSQATFRALLEAMSRPGKICRLPTCRYEGAPAGFCAPALSIMKTLCDHRVCFSLGCGLHTHELARYLEVNLATPFGPMDTADYALLDGSSYDTDFARLKRGSPEFPESSATAILSVHAMEPGDAAAPEGVRLALRGPGVQSRTVLAVLGLDPRYAEARGHANRLSPQGIDLFLVDPQGRVTGIPRTTTMEVA